MTDAKKRPRLFFCLGCGKDVNESEFIIKDDVCRACFNKIKGDAEPKTLIERIEEKRKTLKTEYQRGFVNGGKDMNEKWMITRKEFYSEFVKKLKKLDVEIFDESSFDTTLKIRQLIKEYKEL